MINEKLSDEELIKYLRLGDKITKGKANDTEKKEFLLAVLCENVVETEAIDEYFEKSNQRYNIMNHALNCFAIHSLGRTLKILADRL